MTERNPYDDAVSTELGLAPAHKPTANPYEPVVDSMLGAEAPLRQVAIAHGDRNPDQVARARTLAERQGIPVQVAMDNVDYFDRQQHENDVADLAHTAPATAAWLSKPENYGVAKDDLSVIGGLEKAWHGYTDAPRAFVGGVVGDFLGLTTSGFGRAVASAGRGAQRDPSAALAPARSRYGNLGDAGQPEAARAAGEDLEAIGSAVQGGGDLLQDLGNWIKPPTERQNFVTDVIGGGGQVAGQVVTGGAGTLGMFAQGYEIGAERAEAAGASTEQTDKAAAQSAVITGLSEKLGMKWLMRFVPGWAQKKLAGKVGDLLLAGAGEGAQEVTEGVGHDIVATEYDPNTKIGSGITQDFTVAGAVGFLARAALHEHPRVRQIDDSARGAAFVDQLHAAVSASKLAQRSPEALGALVQALKAQGGPQRAYIDAETFVGLFQSEREAYDAARDFAGDATALPEAIAAGGDLSLPIESAARLLASPLGEKAKAALRLDADHLPASELASVDAKAEVEAVAKEMEQQLHDATPAAPDPALVEQLSAVYSVRDARAMVMLLPRFYAGIARITGREVADVQAQYPVEVVAGQLDALRGASLTQPPTRADEVSTGLDPATRVPAVSLAPITTPPEQLYAESAALLRERQADSVAAPDGSVVRMTGTGARKMLSKGRRDPLRQAVARALPELIAAAPIHSTAADSHNRNLRFAYAASAVKYEGKVYPVRLVYRVAQDGDLRAYDFEGFEMAEPGAVVAGHTDESAAGIADQPDSTEPSLAQLQAAFNVERPLFQPADGGPGGPRGAIQFPEPGIGVAQTRTLILLASSADRSTFLHEAGHFFLEVLANEPKAAAEFDRVLGWFGVADRAAWNALDFEGKRPLHEQFARGFEHYLAEGRPPAPGLRGAFRRFKSWMVGVYRDLRALQVEISDDIRDVFDRLLASEDEIAAVARQQRYEPVVPVDEAVKLGLSPERLAGYASAMERAKEALAAKLLEAKTREAKSSYRNEVKAEQARLEPILRDRPVYQLRELIKGGRKLDYEATHLAAAFINPTDAMPAAERLRGYTVAGGVDPAMMADIVGFPSVEAMVRDLIEAPPLAEVVREQAESIVHQRYGDPLTDGTVPALAVEALHNARLTRAVDQEIALLAELAKEPPRAAPDLRAIAHKLIGDRTARQLDPNQHLVAERKAANEAAKHAAAGKFGEALAAKRRQAYNAVLYSEARRAQEDVGRVERTVRRLSKKAARARIGRAGGTYAEQLEALLSTFRFTGQSGSARDRLQVLQRWYDREVAAGKVPTVPDSVLEQLQDRTPHYEDVPVQALRDLREQLLSLAELARNDLSIELDGQRRDLLMTATDTGDAIRASLKDRGPPPSDALLARDFWHANGKRLRVAGAALIRLETLAEWVDGKGNVNGHLYRYIIRPLERAQTAYLDHMRDYGERFVALLAEHSKATGGLGERFAIASIGETFTKAGVLAVALNTGNADNLQRLRDGRGWGPVQLTEILSHMDEADWRFVQASWDLLESLWPQISAQQKRMTGLAPPKVAAVPVETPFGTFPGGYFPIQYDRDSPQWQAFARETTGDGLFDPDILVSMPQNGHTKARVAAAKLPLRFDLQSIPQHLSRVLKDLTHRETLVDIHKLTTRPEVTGALQDTLGSEFNDMLATKLREVATDQQFAASKIVASASRVSWAIRRRIGVAAMGLNTITAAKQLLGITSGTEVLGADLGLRAGLRYQVSGYMDLLHHWGSILDDAAALSGEMRHRLQTASLDIRRSQQEYLEGRLRGGPLGKLQNADAALRAHAYILLRYVQTYAVDLPLWYGAMRAGSEVRKLSPADAVAYADSVVRRSQGAGGAKDTAIVEGMPGAELFTMFYSYASAYLQRQAHVVRDVGKAKQRGALFASLPNAAARVALVAVIPVILEDLINQAVGSADGPGDDDSKLWYFLQRIAAFQFYGLPVFRDAAPSMFGASKFEPRLSPAQSALDSVNRIAKDGKRQFEYVTGEAPEGVEARKAARDSVNAVGMWFGLPVAPYKSIDYLWRVLEGEEDPDSLPEFTAAFLAGKREEK